MLGLLCHPQVHVMLIKIEENMTTAPQAPMPAFSTPSWQPILPVLPLPAGVDEI